MNEFEKIELIDELKRLFGIGKFHKFLMFFVWILIMYPLSNAPVGNLTTMWLKTIALLIAGLGMIYTMDRWLE